MTVEPSLELARAGQQARHPVDAPSAIVAAAYLISLNALVANIQPLILGALARDYGFSDRQLGHVSSVYVGSITLCTLSAPLWIRRINWRLLAFAAVAACAATFAWGSTLHSPAMFFVLFAMLGLLKGGFGGPAYASLGDSANPDRAYGISTVFQGLSAAAISAPVESFIVPQYGVQGLLLFLAGLYATGLVAARWMPASGRAQSSPSRGPSAAPPITLRAAAPPIIAALALALFAGGVLAFWYFVERIGAARGVPADLIGLTISVTALCSIATAGAMAWLSGRLPSLAFVAAGTALIVASYLVLTARGDASFMICNLLFALGWGFSTPAYAAIVRKVDATGRLFVAVPAASGGAGVAIGIVAGPIIDRGGYDGLLLFSGALIVGAMFVALWSVRLVLARQRGG